MIQTQLIFCGDNLAKLREIPDESIDLIYIDPPFNSNRNYEVFWGDAKEKRSFDDRFGAVEHYIFWMRPRVSELYRVLKKTGSFYYHCDWHADGYVRVLLDQVFGADRFNTHVVWKRTSSHNDAKRGFGNLSDSIYFYTKGDNHVFNVCYQEYTQEYIESNFKYCDPDGRRYSSDNLRSPNPRPNLTYDYKGFKPHPNGWTISLEKMKEWDSQGRIIFPATPDGRIRVKKYLDEMSGIPVGNVWTDIQQLSSQSAERLGYPTQKPLALLDRIIKASSNPGDVVLDAFCGCGTTLHAAQNLGRRWIGIDVSPTSCRVMAKRLEDHCFIKEGKDFWVRDLPKTVPELRKYPAFEFENWAVNALNTVIANGQAIANRAKVGDMGIDGRIYPVDTHKEKAQGQDLFGEMDRWFPVQVKQQTREGGKVGRPDIDNFQTAMKRQRRDKGFFVAFDYSSDALREVARAAREESLEIIPITVQEILDEEVHYRI